MEFKTKEFVFLLVLGVLISALGIGSFLRGKTSHRELISSEEMLITIHVAGCVKRPGVYELSADCRIIDAIGAAGGETDEADINRLNLAEFIRDGQKVNVPARIEPGESGLGLTNGLVNINTADQATLETLPNIGPARAQKIIQYREEHGYFSSIDEITKVNSIGFKIFESIKGLITN